MQKVILPLILVAVLVVGAFGYFLYQDGTFDALLASRTSPEPVPAETEEKKAVAPETKKTPQTTTIMANQNTPEADALIKEAKASGEKLRALYSGGSDLTPEKQTEADALQARFSEISAELQVLETDGVEVGIQTSTYGYEISASLNGVVLPSIQGGMSTGARFYSKNHFMAEMLAPEFVSEYTTLLVGENTLTITYKKIGEKSSHLTLEVFAYEPPFTLLDVAVTGDAGTIEKKFIVQPTKPADATTITVKE